MATAGLIAVALPVQGQVIVRPPASRAVAARPVKNGSLVMINTSPAQPTVTYGTPRTAGYVASSSYGSAAYGAYSNPPVWGFNSSYPTYGINSVPGALYGTYGVPSYDYNYYGGAPGGSGTFTPGLTIGVGNLGFGPWTYVGPVY
ncbi:MAG: hypothetical protein U0800_12185 [Isosphaeraceae bacterium]